MRLLCICSDSQASETCRTNPSCSLNIQPCLLNGQTISTVDIVKDLR